MAYDLVTTFTSEWGFQLGFTSLIENLPTLIIPRLSLEDKIRALSKKIFCDCKNIVKSNDIFQPILLFTALHIAGYESDITILLIGYTALSRLLSLPIDRFVGLQRLNSEQWSQTVAHTVSSTSLSFLTTNIKIQKTAQFIFTLAGAYVASLCLKHSIGLFVNCTVLTPFLIGIGGRFFITDFVVSFLQNTAINTLNSLGGLNTSHAYLGLVQITALFDPFISTLFDNMDLTSYFNLETDDLVESTNYLLLIKEKILSLISSCDLPLFYLGTQLTSLLQANLALDAQGNTNAYAPYLTPFLEIAIKAPLYAALTGIPTPTIIGTTALAYYGSQLIYRKIFQQDSPPTPFPIVSSHATIQPWFLDRTQALLHEKTSGYASQIKAYILKVPLTKDRVDFINNQESIAHYGTVSLFKATTARIHHYFQDLKITLHHWIRGDFSLSRDLPIVIRTTLNLFPFINDILEIIRDKIANITQRASMTGQNEVPAYQDLHLLAPHHLQSTARTLLERNTDVYNYGLPVSSNLIKTHPEALLLHFSRYFKQPLLPTFNFFNEEDHSFDRAIDAGGIRRQIISNLIQNIFENPKTFVKEIVSEKMILRIHPDYSTSQETLFSIGLLMGHAYQSQSKGSQAFVLGPYFDISLFEMLQYLPAQELDLFDRTSPPENFSDPIAKAFLVKQFQDSPPALEAIKNIINNKPSQDDTSLLEGIFEAEGAANLSDYFNGILDPNKRNELIALLCLAQGMKTLLGSSTWDSLRQKPKEEIMTSITGYKLTLNHFTCKQNQHGLIRWFENWFQQQDPKKLLLFTQRVTGNTTLPLGKKITIELVSEPITLPKSHTCFFKLDLNNQWNRTLNEQQFHQKLNIFTDYAEGFGVS